MAEVNQYLARRIITCYGIAIQYRWKVKYGIQYGTVAQPLQQNDSLT